MAAFLKVELTPDGLARTKTGLRVVESLAKATPLHHSDAMFFYGKASQKWPEYKWGIEPIHRGIYVVKGTHK